MMTILKIPANKKDPIQEIGFPYSELEDRIKEHLGDKYKIVPARPRTGIKDRRLCLITGRNARRKHNARASRIRIGFPFVGIRGDAIVCAIDWSGYAQSLILTDLTNEEIYMLRKILKK